VETVGLVTSVVVGVVVVAGAALFLINLPDLARYRRLKKM
jgi:hypothetical protein